MSAPTRRRRADGRRGSRRGPGGGGPRRRRRHAGREVAGLRPVGQAAARPAASAASDVSASSCWPSPASAVVLGPKILGHATDLIFDGVIGRRLPAGVDQAQVVGRCARRARAPTPTWSAASTSCPGTASTSTRSATCCSACSCLYVGVVGAVARCRATCSPASCSGPMFRLRADVEDKLNRLPLRYFDQQPRGELLSRVTNDIDNIAQSLQQTLSQLLTSLLTRRRRA